MRYRQFKAINSRVFQKFGSSWRWCFLKDFGSIVQFASQEHSQREEMFEPAPLPYLGDVLGLEHSSTFRTSTTASHDCLVMTEPDDCTKP